MRISSFSNKIRSVFLCCLFSFCNLADVATAQTYTVSYANLTPQTLTTSVCAVHNSGNSIFKTSQRASEGLATLAEDGSHDLYVNELRKKSGLLRVSSGAFVSAKTTGIISVNASSARRQARTHVSCVLGMLAATNDAFVGFNNRRLPVNVGEKVRSTARSYDAGSEVNTESCEHIPGGPCDAHFVGLAENSFVKAHPGILGGVDLSPALHGWSEPAARVVITRTK